MGKSNSSNQYFSKKMKKIGVKVRKQNFQDYIFYNKKLWKKKNSRNKLNTQNFAKQKENIKVPKQKTFQNKHL